MEYEVEIVKGGISFVVKVFTDDGALDFVDKVEIKSGNNWVPVSFDSDDFIRDFEDELYQAIEEERNNAAAWAAEQRMDAKREEGWE